MEIKITEQKGNKKPNKKNNKNNNITKIMHVLIVFVAQLGW